MNFDIPENVFVKDFLPGDVASAHADLVISNGGSPTSYQALANGVPVLGIASNMDQLLSMEAIENLKAGKLLRLSKVNKTTLEKSLNQILNNDSYKEAARKIAKEMEKSDFKKHFKNFLDSTLQP